MEGPKALYISPTNLCNHNCHICARHDYMRKDRGFMSIKLFNKILNEIPDSVETICLHKQGESTLHPVLPEMIKLLKAKHPKIKLKLNTNLVNLNDDLIESFINHVDVLTVSIHSINKETYKKLHGANTYDKVMKNLCILKEKAKDSNMELWIDYVWQEENKYDSDEDVVWFFKNLLGNGFTINFWWCINFMDMGKEGKIRIYDEIPNTCMPYCIYPWYAMSICWDGKVNYCFVDPEEKIFLGDLHGNTIEEIWDSPSYNSFREVLLQRDFDQLDLYNIKCKKCSFLWSKQTQDYTKLPIDLCEEFSRHWKNCESLYETALLSEAKSLKDFYGKRVKI